MVALRSRRLESIFGGPLDGLTADQVRGLVDAGVQEDVDLDFKLMAYGRTDHDRRALAGDVAALANTAGGIIAIGIDEDDQARATGAPGITVTDTEVGRIRQVVASLVSPMPHLDVLRVLDEPVESGVDAKPSIEDAAEPGEPPSAQGFILIAVPRSPNAPHAVLVNDALRYPKRNGATTRYLSEPEVAAAYRDRLAGAARQDQHVVEVEQQAIKRLDVSDPRPWVVVTLVPDLPGDLALSRDVFQSFERQIIGSPAAVVERWRPLPALEYRPTASACRWHHERLTSRQMGRGRVAHGRCRDLRPHGAGPEHAQSRRRA